MTGDPHTPDTSPPDEPQLDGRTREDVLAELTEIAPYYVDNWDADRPDAGTALLDIFAGMCEDVIERLDRVPEKQRAAFLDSLGFAPHPPQPSKLPVTFTVDETATDTVDIPVGTTVEAGGTDDREPQQFETVSEKFVATPATITDAIAVDPGTDRIVDHWDSLSRGENTTLFTGENRQDHALYLGDTELLQLAPGATIEVELRTNATEPVLRDYLQWEYFGENEAGEEGWQPLAMQDRQEPDPPVLSESRQVSAVLDRLERFLEREGYQQAAEQGPSALLVRSIADDVRNGRFGSPGDDDTATPRLPPGLFGTADVREPVVRKIQHQLATLQDRFQQAAIGGEFGESFERVDLTLTIPGTVTEREVDGVAARWIRARIPEAELAPALYNLLVDSVTLSVGSETAGASTRKALDEAVANDVSLPLSDDSPLRLFGEEPTGESRFLFACREALTKSGATVTLTFEHVEATPTAAFSPELAWEYWNGTGWRRLSVDDDTEGLQQSGTVQFEVPSDLEPTTEQGTEALWIQVRLIGGDYGQPRMEEVESNDWERVTDHISPPTYRRIAVGYDRSSIPFDHTLTRNNASYHQVHTGEFQPFESPPGETQALYLGLDRRLDGGPLTLYLPIQGTVYPEGFTPWIDVEYCADPPDGWRRVDLHDGTADLTEQGILEFTLPEPTTASSLFGRERHWIRIRVTGDEFVPTDETVFVPRADRDGTGPSHRELAYQSVTDRERRNRSRTPPVMDGLHLNTQWARNIQTTTDETLGSARGTAGQELAFPTAPVLDATVWIDEIEALSERQADSLVADQSVTVREARDGDGSRTALWVRWEAVPDFFDSGPGDRQYRLEETSGRLVFGDGTAGKIPPEGENNVRVDYRTGGGDDGDVAAGTVESLLDPLPSIEAVTNPEPGETGEDAEPLSELVERAPEKLRHRGKPVTRDGFRRIAQSASREIERVCCRAGEDEAGVPGALTLLIVPGVEKRKPIPSEELLAQVEAELETRAPAAVMDGEHSAVTVRGPHYVELSVSVTLVAAGTRSLSDVTDIAESSLTAFAHPLTGGPDGDGWEIGEAPPPGLFAAHLEQLDAVERVGNLAVTFRDGEQERTLAGSEAPPRVSPDVLVYSGRHDVTVELDTDGER